MVNEKEAPYASSSSVTDVPIPTFTFTRAQQTNTRFFRKLHFPALSQAATDHIALALIKYVQASP